MLSFQKNNNIKSRRRNGNIPSLNKKCREKGAPDATCAKGSLTVEAALVMPLFIAAVVSVLFIIQAIQTEIRIQKALYNQIMKISGFAYYINTADLSDSVEQVLEAGYIKDAVIKEVGSDYLDKSNIVNGSDGISVNFLVKAENGMIDVSLTYKMAVPFNLFGIKPIRFVTRMKNHTWIGKTDSDSNPDGDTVYVTASGSVYHLYRDCSYIMSSIKQTDGAGISSERNSSGEIYRPCKVCCSEEAKENDNVYYTLYGNRYHIKLNCSNLYSNVYIIEKCKAEKTYRLCSKCEKRSKA